VNGIAQIWRRKTALWHVFRGGNVGLLRTAAEDDPPGRLYKMPSDPVQTWRRKTALRHVFFGGNVGL